MSKTTLITLAVVAIILLVVFGRGMPNFLEKKRLESMNKGLVYRIMKNNDPDFGKKPRKPPERTTGVDFGLDTTADKVPTEVEGNVYGRKGFNNTGSRGAGFDAMPSQARTGFNSNIAPSYVDRNERPDGGFATPSARMPASRADSNPSQQLPTPPAASQDEYYPPTPAANTVTPQRPAFNNSQPLR
jgi:hypothetical protein